MNVFTKPLVFTVLFLAMLISSVFPQDQSDYQLHFKNFTLETKSDFGIEEATKPLRQSEIFEGTYFRIIQFDQLPTSEQRRVMAINGIELLDYIPHFGFFARIDHKFSYSSIEDIPVRTILEINRDIKLAPMLYDENYPDYALRPGGKIEVIVSVFDETNPEKAQAHLKEAGFEVLDRFGGGDFFIVIAMIEEIDNIAAIPFVNYIEPRYPEPVHDNYTGRTSHRSNAIANDFEAGRNYDGSGVSVMLQDDGKIGPHIDFEGRIKEQFVGFFGGDHGDHCAGIIGAAGNLDPKARGNAFGADLYVYSAAPVYPGFSSIPSHYFDYDIRVTSTSYSDGCNAGYTSLARSLDMQIINYPSLMHVFSAGNNGTSNCGYGAGSGWGNITGGHKVGKNVITVANLDYLDNLSSSSSRGPAHDGRIKPDISAKGTSVYSTLPNDEYGNKTGTSMSCPGVAGVVTQLYDAYRQLNNDEDPTGGLIKGIVLNTAEDLGNPGPDFRFGWGRINALRAVKILEEERYEEASIDNGENNIHQFEVPENTGQLRVMVYWTDVQGSVNTNWALVNNLDIRISDPQGGEWLPWTLNHYPHPDSLNKPAIRGNDDRNNVEQVTIDNPEAGVYSLTVDGINIPLGPQTYYVIYEYIPKTVVLSYPAGGETMIPGETEVIRWDAFGNDKTFSLEISLDNGNTWQVINDNINENARYLEWNVLYAVSGEAIMRLSDGENIHQSEPFTIISRPADLTIDWVCDDAVHLSWSYVAGANEYTVWQLGEKYMEPVGTTSINSMIVNNVPANQIHRFSVSANTPDGKTGQRANAVKKNPGILNCNETDAWITSVPSADWGIFQSCLELQNLMVVAEMKNFGLEPIINPGFTYQLNDGEIFSESYDGIVEPDSTLKFSFNSTINISDPGIHALVVSVIYPDDQNPGNNNFNATIEVVEGVAMTPGTVQVFDNFSSCLPVPICELYACELEESWYNLENGLYDEIDWRTWQGSTNSQNTGPTADHTTGTSDGKYLYLEATVLCYYKTATLIMPCVDLTEAQSPALDFWYHAHGADIGSLHVDIFSDGQIFTDIVSPLIGDQGDEWKNMVIDLSDHAGNVIGIRFRGTTGGGDAGDLALDDISITQATSVDDFDTIKNFSIFPNPTNGMVKISASNAGLHDYSLTIFNLLGRQVYSKPINNVEGQINAAIDLSALPKGVYFVELKSSNNSYQSKLTIQ
jgi:hypothetical protein